LGVPFALSRQQDRDREREKERERDRDRHRDKRDREAAFDVQEPRSKRRKEEDAASKEEEMAAKKAAEQAELDEAANKRRQRIEAWQVGWGFGSCSGTASSREAWGSGSCRALLPRPNMALAGEAGRRSCDDVR
jgi:hypothetical protein